MPTDISTPVRALYDIFNRRAFDELASVVTPDASFVDVASGNTFRGPTGYRQYMEGWLHAFPDGRVNIRKIRTGTDFCCVEFEGTGTNNGPLETPTGEVHPTHRTVREMLCDIHDIKNNKIVGSTTYYDWVTMMRQLGVLPELARA